MTSNDSNETSGAIEVDFIGHATLMVHTADVRCIFDPVLFDQFHEGLFQIYPPRRLDIGAMPVPDVVVLTHRHLDHFDIASLRALPTREHIVIPDDSLLHEMAERVGFVNITRVRDWDSLRFGDTEFVFTPSLLRVPEVGVLIRCRNASFWNQVDTAIDQETAARVSDLVGKVSFLLAPWQPSFEAPLQYNKSTRFPVETYVRQLKRAAAVETVAIAPGACGFRHSNEYSWQDQLTFPATRERFLYDYAQLPNTGGTYALVADPGDRIVVNSDNVVTQRNKVAWVTPEASWNAQDLRFSPTLPSYGTVPFPPDADQRAIAALEHLKTLLNDFWVEPEGGAAVQRAQAWQVIFMLEVSIDSRRSMYAHLDFRSGGRPRLEEGFSALANAHASIDVVSLEQLLEGRASWDRLVHSGAYRTHSSVFSLSGSQVRVPEPPAVFDPLWNIFPFEALERRALETSLSAPLQIAVGHT